MVVGFTSYKQLLFLLRLSVRGPDISRGIVSNLSKLERGRVSRGS